MDVAGSKSEFLKLDAPWRIEVLDEVTSTNETILQAGERGAPEWTVHVARSQTNGRGRSSHTWWSPRNRGLWMSVLLRPTTNPARLGGIALIAGVATRRAIEGIGARGVDVYWPNDLFLGPKKLGGILGEVRNTGPSPPNARSGMTIVALGIGINIELDPAECPPELRGRVASLADAGVSERDPVRIAAAILGEFSPVYDRLLCGAAIADLLAPGPGQRGLAGIGEQVEVRVPDEHGQRVLRGRIAGVGPLGELLVDTGRSIEAFASAEVRYEE